MDTTDLMGDIRYAVRGWRRSPGFAATVVVTLALGLGLASAIFAFADGYLFRPLPFPGGDRTYYVRDPHAAIASLLRASDLAALRQSPVVEYGFVEWSAGEILDGQLVIGDRRARLFVYQVSEGFRNTLALPLVAGRDFTPEDHAKDAPKVGWLSYRFWQREFGGDRGVLGQVYRAEGFTGPQELRIVGILGPEVSSFDLNNQPPDIVVPEIRQTVIPPNQLAVPLVLLPEGVSVEQASQRISAALQAAAPAADGRPRTVRLHSLQRAQRSGGAPTARVFFAGAMLVLLLASMSLVHLLLGRGAARAGEIATRAAMGASRWRIARGFLVESLLLSSGGIALGLLVGKVLSLMIEARVPRLPTAGRNLSMVPMVFDFRVIAFAVTLGLIVAVVGGLWPAWRMARRPLSAAQRQPGGTSHVSHRLARTILASELTVATVVVVGAVFVGLGIYRYLHQPLGFDYVDRVRVVVQPPAGVRLTPADSAAALRAVRAVPGVTSAGHESTVTMLRDVEVPSRVLDTASIHAYGTTAGYFETWGMRLREGRLFEPREYEDGSNVVVVNASFAQLAWPDTSAIGKTVRAGGRLREVVGVIESRRFSLEAKPAPMIHVPESAAAGRGSILAWAPGADPADIRTRVTSAIDAAAPGMTVTVTPLTFDGLYSRAIGEARFQTPVVVAFGVLAVILAGIGVFGLVSYLVERRQREFGIRMALGARRLDVWRTVVRESVQPTLIGLVAGSAGAYGLERVVRSSVFGWSSSGALTLVIVSAGLLVVAVLAALGPAARAVRVDPAITLRAE